MPESLSRCWSGLGRPKVLVVGDLILDRYVWGTVERISPEPPIPVLTVAAAGDNALRGGGLLAIYALGTVLPLFIIASLWDTTGIGKAKWLRGWGVQIGPLAIHSTNLIAGTVFLLLGLSFIFLDGTNALSGVYSDLGFTELSFQADERIKDITSWIPDGVFIGGVLLLLAIWMVVEAAFAFRRYQRSRAEGLGIL